MFRPQSSGDAVFLAKQEESKSKRPFVSVVEPFTKPASTVGIDVKKIPPTPYTVGTQKFQPSPKKILEEIQRIVLPL